MSAGQSTIKFSFEEIDSLVYNTLFWILGGSSGCDGRYYSLVESNRPTQMIVAGSMALCKSFGVLGLCLC